jgi:lipopolysaccharide export system protein LptC
MSRLGAITLALFTLAGAAEPAAPAARPQPSAAPAHQWVLPVFSDREGYRLMTLRGAEVRPSGEVIAIRDLMVTVFSGDAAAKVDSILMSPAAEFRPGRNVVSGDRSVRFLQDEVEVTGGRWTFDQAAKKVSLRENVRVTFKGSLNDILR